MVEIKEHAKKHREDLMVHKIDKEKDRIEMEINM